MDTNENVDAVGDVDADPDVDSDLDEVMDADGVNVEVDVVLFFYPLIYMCTWPSPRLNV